MADNLLEAITGAVSGFTASYVPFQKELNKKRLNSTRVSDYEKLTGEKTGLHGSRLLSEDEVSILTEKLKERHELDKEKQKSELKRESDLKLFQEENPNMETLYPGKKFDDPLVNHMNMDQFLKYKADQNKEEDRKKKSEHNKVLEDHLSELDSVIADVDSLYGKYKNSNTGILGGFTSTIQHIPGGGTFTPDTKLYKDSIQTTALNVQKALTKTSRALGAGLKAETIAFPEVSDDFEKKGKPQFMEVFRKLKDRRNETYRRLGRDSEVEDLTPYSVAADKLNPGDKFKPKSRPSLDSFYNK